MSETEAEQIDPQLSNRSNVVLTGFMGTGKTTVGLLLAELLGFAFVDTDEEIERRHGPIPTIFSEAGESCFRQMERDLAAELALAERHVIATGGRFLLDPANEATLCQTGQIFCLTATAEEVMARVVNNPAADERPLLAGADPFQRIVDLLRERADAYGKFTQIDTSGRRPREIADELYAACVT